MSHSCKNCHGTGEATCPRCGGDGKIQNETCYYCNGKGTVKYPACEGKGIINE